MPTPVENEERFLWGLAYELSANSKLFAAVIDSSNDYSDAVESGVDLQQSLIYCPVSIRVDSERG